MSLYLLIFRLKERTKKRLHQENAGKNKRIDQLTPTPKIIMVSLTNCARVQSCFETSLDNLHRIW